MAVRSMTSAQFRRITAPVLNTVFDGVYEQRTGEYKQIFTVKAGEARASDEMPILGGLPAAPFIADGEPVSYASGRELFNSVMVYQEYGLAISFTRTLIQDGKAARLGPVYARHLGQALAETREIIPANLINRSFVTTAGAASYDGQAIISTAHPDARGLTQSNRLTGDAAFGQAALEALVQQIGLAVNEQGLNIKLNVEKLVVPTSLMMQAMVVINSTLRSGTANNDINPVRKFFPSEPAIITRLSSPTAWFVTTDAPDGNVFLHRDGGSPDRDMEGDFETNSMRYKGMMRFAVANRNWRQIYGSPGA